jgi:beta-galactosidase
MTSLRFPNKLCYGGDYNPEQWPEEVWLDDMRLMRKAGVNFVSIGIFSWALLQPNADTYDFAWLDRLMDLLAENGIYADLATATASPPAWMAVNHPDILPVDENGAQFQHGSRQHYCPNSRTYREYSKKLVTLLAERYQNHPALTMWHVNNEYGCHINRCYCDQCAEAFRIWLEVRYQTIDELNARWGTNFWSQKYYRWEEIGLPSKTPTFANPGQLLDYQRFMSDSLLDCYLNEYHVLKEMTPEIPVLTNFMPHFKPLDYFKWAQHLDIVTWDSYPEPTKGIPVDQAFDHDLMRSLRHGQPFLLMEQVTSNVNWREHNPMKRPGVMRLWSYQAVAHGGDGVMFFQWRASQAGAEKYHGAMVTHTGDEHSRVYREVAQLGNELKKLDSVVGSRIQAKTAIIFDYDNWWALELPSKPNNDLKYIEQVMQYYSPLFHHNIAVDIVQPSQDLSAYDLVIAPALYMVKPGVAENLEQFVERGGTLVTTFFSGIVDENDRIHMGGYPAPLRKLLGICVEEFDAMLQDQHNAITATEGSSTLQGTYRCSLWADVIRLEGAQALAYFGQDFIAGSPAVTVNTFGQGRAYYVGTQADERFVTNLIQHILAETGIQAPIDAPKGVEVTCREQGSDRTLFLLNHHAETMTVPLKDKIIYQDLLQDTSIQGQIELPANGVAVLRFQS